MATSTKRSTRSPLLAMDLDVAVATTGNGTARKRLKAIKEFHTYIRLVPQ
jgi:hypothetical protein